MRLLSNLIVNLKGWNASRWPLPWDAQRPALFQFVVQNVMQNPDPEAGYASLKQLPDEEVYEQRRQAALSDEETVQRFGFLPGAEDSLFFYYSESNTSTEEVDQVFEALQRCLQSSSASHRAHFYELLLDRSPMSYLDALIARIHDNQAAVSYHRLWLLMAWLATKAPDRNPVKLALALLVFFPEPEVRAVVHALGRHEEFTLFAATVLGNQGQAAEDMLFDLAQSTIGWGRIHAVRCLAHTQNPEIKRGLLIEGHHNIINGSYSALVCAEAGDLRATLAKDVVEPELLEGIAKLLQLLLQPDSPAASLADYAEGADAASLYLDHVENRPPELAHYGTIYRLKQWVSDSDVGWEALAERGWTDEVREAITTRCRSLLLGQNWKALYLPILDDEDSDQFHLAANVAQLDGYDPWERFFDRQEQGIEDSWWLLMQTSERWRIDRALALAEAQLLPRLRAERSAPLSEDGPSGDMNLLMIVQELHRFPGAGWPCLEAALENPMPMCRLAALRSLESWGPETWADEVWEALRLREPRETDPDLRAKLRYFLGLAH